MTNILYTDYTHYVYYLTSSSSLGELFGRSQGQLGWRLQCCILAIICKHHSIVIWCNYVQITNGPYLAMEEVVPLTCWESNAFDAQAVGPRTNWWATFMVMKALDGKRLPLIALGSSCHNQWNLVTKLADQPVRSFRDIVFASHPYVRLFHPGATWESHCFQFRQVGWEHRQVLRHSDEIGVLGNYETFTPTTLESFYPLNDMNDIVAVGIARLWISVNVIYFSQFSWVILSEVQGYHKVVPGAQEKDLARSLLQMVTQQSVLLASAYARMAGCINRQSIAFDGMCRMTVWSRGKRHDRFCALCLWSWIEHAGYIGLCVKKETLAAWLS